MFSLLPIFKESPTENPTTRQPQTPGSKGGDGAQRRYDHKHYAVSMGFVSHRPGSRKVLQSGVLARSCAAKCDTAFALLNVSPDHLKQ